MDKGIVQVICGAGSGKTSMALGKGIGAMANNKKVIMIQFLKGALEQELSGWLKRLEPDLKVFRFEKQFCYFDKLSEHQKQEERVNIQNGTNFAKKVLTTGECDVLILDEFLGILDLGLISVEEFESMLSLREENVSLILTGKVCPPEIKKYADLVTRIEDDKATGTGAAGIGNDAVDKC